MTFYTSFLYFIKIYCHSSTDASIQHFCYHTYPIQIRVQPYLESIKRKKKNDFFILYGYGEFDRTPKKEKNLTPG